ncbi:hypothetical protein PGR6_17810 [Pseudomonas sp. GR 6-02]|nr:hypothetical protein PGR6_17810 [Pseudomonas sp. GR 6-02]
MSVATISSTSAIEQLRGCRGRSLKSVQDHLRCRGAIDAHPLITVTRREPEGIYDQWSPRADPWKFVMKRKVPDVQ